MQYLEGETLEQRLKKGALPIDQALRYAIQISDALDKAHRSGIVHRDLKPGNVMLTKTGATLLDFGLAKTAMSAGAVPGLSRLPTPPPNLTAQGTILGTFQVHGPGADRGTPGRRPHGRLCVRCGALRDAHRQARVRRTNTRRSHQRDPEGRTASDRRTATADATLARSHCQTLPRERAGRALANISRRDA